MSTFSTLPLRLIARAARLTQSNWGGTLLLTLPFIGIGFWLTQTDGLSFSRGVWITLLWLTLAPFLILLAIQRVEKCLEELKDIFMKNQKEELLKKFYRLLGSKEYFFYGSVFFLLGLAITLPSVFIDYTGYQKIWAVLANFFVLMLAGLGIAESIAIRRILNAILKADLQLNPHHPDHFLGLKPIGTLAVVTALLVATISMLFPLAFEAVSYFESNSPFLKLLTYGFLAFTIVVIFYTFVAPLLAIKKGIEEHKFHFILASELEYQQKLAKFKKGEDKKITKDYLDTLLRERERMEKIKLFPFEAQMLMEITFSLLLPILILILEIKMRTTG